MMEREENVETPTQLRDRAEGMSVGGPFEIVMALAVVADRLDAVAERLDELIELAALAAGRGEQG